MRLRAVLFAATVLAPLGASAEHRCQCLYQGRRFDLGQLVCIRVDGATRLARCDMQLNNSSWTFLSSGCPTAALFTPLSGGRMPAPPKLD